MIVHLSEAILMFSKIVNLKYILFLSFAFLIVSCSENTIQPELTGSISGKVINQETGAPLPGASVTTSPPTNALITDANGSFFIGDVAVGNYNISVTKNEFDKSTVAISVRESQTASAMVYLEKKKNDNSYPTTPINPKPVNSAVDQPVTLTLQWQSSDPDKDSLKYDLYLYEAGSLTQQKVAENITDTSYTLENLKYSTSYYWQVAAKDTSGNPVFSETWSFTTVASPNNPIIFVSNRDGNYEIYSVDSVDNNLIRLTNNSARDLYPRISPNGQKIAFTSDRSGDMQIYVMDINGSNVQQVTSVPVAGFHNKGIGFTWNTVGDKIYYSNYNRLYRVDISGANLTLIATAPANRTFREVSYSDVSGRLAVLTVGVNEWDSEIYLMNLDGTNQTMFVNNVPGIIGSPEFSIDGRRLMYTQDLSGYENINNRQLNSNIIIRTISNFSDSTNLSTSKTAGTNDLYPRFSRDGSKVIFSNVINTDAKEAEIWIIDIDGHSRQRVTVGFMPDHK